MQRNFITNYISNMKFQSHFLSSRFLDITSEIKEKLIRRGIQVRHLHGVFCNVSE